MNEALLLLYVAGSNVCDYIDNDISRWTCVLSGGCTCNFDIHLF